MLLLAPLSWRLNNYLLLLLEPKKSRPINHRAVLFLVETTVTIATRVLIMVDVSPLLRESPSVAASLQKLPNK